MGIRSPAANCGHELVQKQSSFVCDWRKRKRKPDSVCRLRTTNASVISETTR
jgi:hypothetical protein